MIFDNSKFKFYDLCKKWQPVLQEEWANDGDWESLCIFDDMCQEMGYNVVYSQTPNWRIGATHAMGDTYYKDKIDRWPNAWKFMQEFGDGVVTGGGYSVLLPHGKINPHEDFDTDGNIIRIQIPIVIPEGDTGIEIDGVIKHWDDIIVFDHSKMHSAWNNTNEVRVMFLFDLPKKICFDELS